ncbi:MAG: hypothetical protein Q9199_002592 [Rusavskia elegans]
MQPVRRISHKIQKHQHTKRHKPRHHKPIPSLLRPNPPNQPIDPRHLPRRPHNPPLHIPQHLPLHAKLLVNRIRLTEHTIRHAVTSIDATAFVEHVVCFCGFGVGGMVGGDVGADGGEEVGALAGVGYGGAEAGEG